MSDISRSVLGEQFDTEFEKKVAACTSASEISEIMKQRSVDLGICKREWDQSILVPTGAENAAPLARVVTINGTKHVVEAADELSLKKKVTDLYRAELAPAAAAATTRQPVAESVREPWAAPEVGADPVDGVLANFLAKQGVSIETLRDLERNKFETSWSAATEQFLRSDAGRSWPGSSRNLEIIGSVIAEHKWVDAPDKVAALTQAYEIMKRDGLVAPTPASEFHERAAKVQSFGELKELASSLFSRG